MSHTALFSTHKEAGAKIINFAGWDMPVVYDSVRKEHIAVRTKAGLFDVSHMGEVEIVGPGAADFCQWITTNNIARMHDQQAQYTLICNNHGGVVDDVIVYRLSDERFLICVNAANTAKDLEWIRGAKGGFDVEIVDRSPEYSQLAIQGPNAIAIVESTLDTRLNDLKRFYTLSMTWEGMGLIIARTGYTGEDGVEIFLPWDRAPKLWEALIDKGGAYGIQPCGLGARDTLRIEMGYPLYGHEISEQINPFEASLGRYVKMDKGEFLGSEALSRVEQNGVERTLVGFKMVDKGIAREGYEIYRDKNLVGNVTSGTLSPSLNESIGMGFIKDETKESESISIMIRGTAREAKLVTMPFYYKN